MHATPFSSTTSHIGIALSNPEPIQHRRGIPPVVVVANDIVRVIVVVTGRTDIAAEGGHVGSPVPLAQARFTPGKATQISEMLVQASATSRALCRSVKAFVQDKPLLLPGALSLT